MSRTKRERFRPDLVKAEREAHELSQEELARALDVTLRTVQRWEWGQTVPHPGQLRRLAGRLGATPDDFFDEPEPAVAA